MLLALRTVWKEGASAWPSVRLEYGTYRAHVERMCNELSDDVVDASWLHWTDLYLGCACAHGHEPAILAYERNFLSALGRTASRYRQLRESPEEVAQALRVHLFVSANGSPPKISEYSGRSPLNAWTQLVIRRMLLNLASRSPKEDTLPHDDIACLMGATRDDPEFVLLRRTRYRFFQEILKDATKLLTARDRSILRHSFVEQRGIDEIGAMYRVHRATAARWIVRAHDAIVQHARSLMKHRLGQREYEDLVRSLSSQVDLSLERYLASSRHG